MRIASTVRVFSNPSGNYGSGVEYAVFANGTWESDSKIADLYLSRMGTSLVTIAAKDQPLSESDFGRMRLKCGQLA